MISDYASLQSAIADYLGRSDLTTAIQLFIAQGESAIYRRLRVAAMEKAFSLTIASGAAAVPDDYLATRIMTNADSVAMERVDAFWLRSQPASTGTPHYYAREGGNFIFLPSADDDTLGGSYYARLPALSTNNTSNWLTTNNPDLILAASLIEASTYIADADALSYWTARLEHIANAVQAADDAERFSGSPLVMKRA